MLFPPVIRQVEDRYDYVVARQDPPTDTGTPTQTDTDPTTPTSTPTTPTSTPTDPGSSTPPSTPPTPPTSSPPDRPPSSTVSRVITQSVSGGGYTTIVTSVVIVTGTDGVTTTVDGGSGGGGSGGSNNIGVIVGASVGGAVAVALIGLIWFILARKARERRHKKYENDIFNPDHTVRGPNFDLGSGPDPEMLPDPYTVPAHHHGQGGPPPMQQYHAYDPYAPVTAGYTAGPTHPMSPYGSAGHHYDASSATSGGETNHGLAGIGAAAMAGGAAGTEYEANRLSGTPSGEATSTGTGTGTGGSAAPLTSRLAKEREAFARSNARFSAAQGNLAPGMVSPTPTGTSLAYVSHGRTTSSQYSTDSAIPNSPIRSDNSHGQPFRTGLGLANPDGSVRAVSPTGTDPGRAISPTGVVVHQDAGRVPDHDDSPEEHEIPPTYDSIAAAPADGRPISGEARPLSSA